MHIVHVHNVCLILFPDILLKFRGVNVFRRAFHHDVNAVLQSRVWGKQNHNSESVSTDGVAPPEIRSEVNYGGGCDHTNRHKHVTKHMQVSWVYINVAYLFFPNLSGGSIVEKGFLHCGVLNLINLRLWTSNGNVMNGHRLFLMQNLHLDQIEDKTHDRYRKHQIAVNLGWQKEPLSRFSEKEDSHYPNGRQWNNWTDNLCTMIPIRVLWVWLFLRNIESDDWDCKAN